MSAQDQTPFEIRVQRCEGGAVLELRGSLEVLEADRVREELETLAADEVPVMVLDLSDLTFVGSAGLAAIVHGHLKNRHHGGQIRLCCVQPAVREVLERTRLTKLFPIYSSVAQSLSAPA